LKACVDIEEFCDYSSVVNSEEETSDVYMPTDASLTEEEEMMNYVQKMNSCLDCSNDEFLEEEDLHYSE